jgi:hypothetical protein
MKNFFLAFTILLCTSISAQGFKGDKVKKYHGKHITPTPPGPGGYRQYFANTAMTKRYKSKDGIFSPKDSLYGKTFLVLDTRKLKEDKEYLFTLLGEKNDTLYYNYSSLSEVLMEFSVTDDSPADPCDDIVIEKDKFTGKVTKESPYGHAIRFVKDNTGVYLVVRGDAYTYSTNARGVIILLKNGNKISKPAQKVSVSYSSGRSYDCTAYITLTEDDKAKLRNSPITDVRMDVYDIEVENGEVYQAYLKCLSPAPIAKKAASKAKTPSKKKA